MTQMFRLIFWSLLVAVLTAGCSDEAARQKVAMRQACLAKLWVAYQDYHAARGRAPGGIDELTSFLDEQSGDKQNDETTSEAIKRLRAGEIVMYWNAALNADGEENEQYVLGFEAAVPRAGGYLVTGGGHVVLVTGNSFKDFKEFPQQPASS